MASRALIPVPSALARARRENRGITITGELGFEPSDDESVNNTEATGYDSDAPALDEKRDQKAPSLDALADLVRETRPGLALILETWDALPAPLQAGIEAMARTVIIRPRASTDTDKTPETPEKHGVLSIPVYPETVKTTPAPHGAGGGKG